VGGKGEADLAFRNLSKPEDWSMDLHGLCQIRQKSLAAVTDHILKALDPTNPEGVAHGRPLDIIQMRYALANVYAYQGEMDKSIEQWQLAYEIASQQLPGALPELEEVLALHICISRKWTMTYTAIRKNSAFFRRVRACVIPSLPRQRRQSSIC
jgi:hypothetical protein